MIGQIFPQLGLENLLIVEVPHADAAPRHLVLIGGAYAAPGGADLALALTLFPRLIQLPMIGHDKVGQRGYLEGVATDGNPLIGKILNLLDQGRRVQHHPVADGAHLAGTQNSRWDEMQHILLPLDHQGMPGVMSALKPHDAVGGLSQQIDNLPFSLITPLGSHHNDVGHLL